MNLFLTIVGFSIMVIVAVMGILSHIGILLTVVLAATGLIGPLFAHLNHEMDQQESHINNEN